MIAAISSGLRQQDPEPAGAEPGDVVGVARVPPQRVGDGRQDAVAPRPAEVGDEPVEPVELDDHDRRRAVVAVDAGVLVGHDPVPLAGRPAGR